MAFLVLATWPQMPVPKGMEISRALALPRASSKPERIPIRVSQSGQSSVAGADPMADAARGATTRSCNADKRCAPVVCCFPRAWNGGQVGMGIVFYRKRTHASLLSYKCKSKHPYTPAQAANTQYIRTVKRRHCLPIVFAFTESIRHQGRI